MNSLILHQLFYTWTWMTAIYPSYQSREPRREKFLSLLLVGVKGVKGLSFRVTEDEFHLGSLDRCITKERNCTDWCTQQNQFISIIHSVKSCIISLSATALTFFLFKTKCFYKLGMWVWKMWVFTTHPKCLFSRNRIAGVWAYRDDKSKIRA